MPLPARDAGASFRHRSVEAASGFGSPGPRACVACDLLGNHREFVYSHRGQALEQP